MEILSNSEFETEQAGAALGARLPAGAVVALYGDLGAGKTAFVRGMAAGMGIKAHVNSPTFTIVNEYLGPRPLFHFDMYRLRSAEELFDIGWEDYLGRAASVWWSGAKMWPRPSTARSGAFRSTSWGRLPGGSPLRRGARHADSGL
jgi:tRNA threonylcarbamoyladenosine biosynthesis protein TsaE